MKKMCMAPSSLGLRDSVEPLFLSDLVSGSLWGFASAKAASSSWRLSTWLLSSSSFVCQSGMLLMRFFRASIAISRKLFSRDETLDGAIVAVLGVVT